MRGWGFCGGSYTGYGQSSAAEETINLFPETVQVPNAKTKVRLVNVPGKRTFATAATTGGRGLLAHGDRLFAVFGDRFVEFHPDASITVHGTILNNGRPVGLVTNGERGNQVFIVSALAGYIFNLNTNALTLITHAGFPADVIACGYLDGYFIAVSHDRFALSDLLDGTLWTTGTGQRAGAADAIVGAMVDHEVLWLFGKQKTEVWYDSGAANFPFEPVPGVFVETGMAATYGVAAFGDSIGWVTQDSRGARQVVRNQGYDPVPISTPAINRMLEACGSLADLRTWIYQRHGHTFLVFSSPDNDLTLQYDATEQQWSRLAYWNTAAGAYEADRGTFHAYVWGKHLTQDRVTGTIWELSMDVYADGDAPRRWLRRSPYLNEESRYVFHQRLEFDVEAGVGLVSGQGSDPTMALRFSDDNGHTWSNEQTASFGASGQFAHRPCFYGLGASRNRIYELSGTDPVKTVINDAYLQVAAGGS